MKTLPDSIQKSLTNQMIAISCLAAALGLVACQPEGAAEKAGQKIDKAVENVGQKIEKATEKADKKIDSVSESLAQQAEKSGIYIDESQDTANNELAKAGQAIDKAINDTGKQLANAQKAVVDAASATGEFVEDSVITTKIKSLIINDEFLKASAVEVITVNGVVTLKGTLASEQLVGRAIGLVNSQQGVKSVKNELMVSASVPSKK